MEKSKTKLKGGVSAVLLWFSLEHSQHCKYNKSEYELQDFKNMSFLVTFLAVEMSLQPIGTCLFCSAVPNPVWHVERRDDEVVTPTKDGIVLMLDDQPTQETTMFNVDAKALYDVKSLQVYQGELGVKGVYHVSVASGTIHFCRRGSVAQRYSSVWTAMNDRTNQVAIWASQMSLATSLIGHPMKLRGRVCPWS